MEGVPYRRSGYLTGKVTKWRMPNMGVSVFSISYTQTYARGTTRWMKPVMWCSFFTFLEKSASKNYVAVTSQRGVHM